MHTLTNKPSCTERTVFEARLEGRNAGSLDPPFLQSLWLTPGRHAHVARGSSVYCRRCGSVVDAMDAFCKGCGTPLREGPHVAVGSPSRSPQVPSGPQMRAPEAGVPAGAPQPPSAGHGVPTVVPPPPLPTPPPKTKTWLVVAVVLVIVIAVAAFALTRGLFLSPAQPQTEGSYASTLADVIEGAAAIPTRYSRTVDDYTSARISESAAIEELRVEQSDMVALRDRMRTLATPCTAYNSMHTSLQAAFANYADAIRETIAGIEQNDPAALDRAVNYITIGNDDADRAGAKLDGLTGTFPNC